MRALFLLLLSIAPAAAQTGPYTGKVRTGPAAFGDWRDDAPGVIRRIDPGSLPPPFQTGSAGNAPRVISRPRSAMLRTLPGLHVSLWATGFDTPRVIRVAPSGEVFLAESGAGRILIFAPGSNAPSVFANRLSEPFGIAFWPPAAPRYVYVAENERVRRWPWTPGTLRPSGRAEMVAELPGGGVHWTRDLAAAPDGSRLFVSVGSGSNVAEGMAPTPPRRIAEWEAAHGLGAAWDSETGRASVLQFRPEGGEPRPYAQGLRNCSGLAVQPGAGALWCAVNERDGLGDNLPPDYATRVAEGAFYGWPWYYIGPHEDPRLRGLRPDLAAHVTVPDVLIQPHSAPLGITFYNPPAGAPAAFPAEYRGDAFVALHGSWNRGTRTGYKVIRLRFRDGKPTGEYEDFLTGVVASDSAVWGRPVDVAVAYDGSLLITEDGNGTIWRVAPGE
jgi:glucose/arabinose dehydrogenase